MRLQDAIREDCVITGLKAGGKKEVLDEMVTEIASRVAEGLGTTGVGHGVAVRMAR